MLGEVKLLLQRCKKILLAAVLLAVILTAGCTTGKTEPPSLLTGNEDAGKPTETRPETQNEKRQSGIPAIKPSSAVEQPKDTPGQDLSGRQDKALVIISENPVFVDTGQLLDELDKELESLFGKLGTMDEINEEELNF